MKKCLIAMVTTLLLFGQVFCVSALEPAPQTVAKRQFRAGFVQDDKAYVYLEMEQTPETAVSLQLKINATNVPQRSGGYLREGGRPVHYLLLVDCSGTVREYRAQIATFVDHVLQETLQGGGTATVTVAGLGDSFRVLMEDYTDPAALQSVLGSLTYNDNNTDLYGGIQAALDYIWSQPHTAGELYQLILVTDGRQDIGGQLGLSSEQMEQLENCFLQRQDLVFHTYGMGAEWSAQELQQAELGRGCHISQVDTSPEDAAKIVADFTNNLYQAVFALETETLPEQEDVQIQVLFGDQPGGTAVVEIPYLGPSVTPQEEEKALPDETVNPPAAEDTDREEAKDDDQDQGKTVLEEEQAASPQKGLWERLGLVQKDGIKIWTLIPVAVIAAIGGWMLRFLVERLRYSSRKNNLSQSNGIRIHFQVERGHCTTRKRVFYLVEELVIGRAPTCDLVFNESEVSEKNSRIRLRNGEVYIEDLESGKGTSIGGMRIYAANRLRNGDVITIGTTVQIRVMF